MFDSFQVLRFAVSIATVVRSMVSFFFKLWRTMTTFVYFRRLTQYEHYFNGAHSFIVVSWKITAFRSLLSRSFICRCLCIPCAYALDGFRAISVQLRCSRTENTIGYEVHKLSFSAAVKLFKLCTRCLGFFPLSLWYTYTSLDISARTKFCFYDQKCVLNLL